MFESRYPLRMFENCKTTTDQGNVGEAYAIAYFVANGYVVSKPLFVNSAYDLLVDDGTIKRVQVKATKAKGANGQFRVNVKSSGCNARAHKFQPFDNTKVDLLFVFAENRQCWVIPTADFPIRSAFTLSEAYDQYRI